MSQDPEPRKGVPQGHHLHALLARGRMIADDLFPGLSDELGALGAARLNAGRDFRMALWPAAGGFGTTVICSFSSMSRPLLESRDRQSGFGLCRTSRS